MTPKGNPNGPAFQTPAHRIAESGRKKVDVQIPRNLARDEQRRHLAGQPCDERAWRVARVFDDLLREPVALVPDAFDAGTCRHSHQQVPVEPRTHRERATVLRVVSEEEIETGRRRQEAEVPCTSEGGEACARERQQQRSRSDDDPPSSSPCSVLSRPDGHPCEPERGVGQERRAEENARTREQPPADPPAPTSGLGGAEGDENEAHRRQRRPSGIEQLPLQKHERRIERDDQSRNQTNFPVENPTPENAGEDARSPLRTRAAPASRPRSTNRTLGRADRGRSDSRRRGNTSPVSPQRGPRRSPSRRNRRPPNPRWAARTTPSPPSPKSTRLGPSPPRTPRLTDPGRQSSAPR